jgi:hypothetical protein
MGHVIVVRAQSSIAVVYNQLYCYCIAVTLILLGATDGEREENSR